MKITTKYNVDEKIRFFPFNRKSLGTTSATIILITTIIKKNINITYTVKDEASQLWDVCEEDIIKA
jgi:hypothetical protein